MFSYKVNYQFSLLMAILIYLTNAETVTKVLQNGKDGYQGCVDSYTFSFWPEDNYSTNDVLFNHNCQN